MWMGNPILDSRGDIKGLTVLHPLIEGDGMDEWHGLIQATVYAVNPLGLRYPDNTNTGRQDFVMPPFLNDAQKHQMLQHLLNTTNFNPELMDAYAESIKNVCELLSVIPEVTSNYWLAGFSVVNLYREGESAYECWNRISEEYGVLDFMASSIANGELQEGMLQGVINAEVEIPERTDTYTATMKRALITQVHNLQHQWGSNLRDGMDRICHEGLIHECKKGDEPVALRRGKLTTKELFLPRLEDWLKTGETPQDKPKVNQTSAENYRRLIEVFKGDGYSIEPYVNRYGDIVLQWRSGPDRMGEAILSGDGAMHLDMDYISTETPKNKAPRFMEMKAHVAFNEDALSSFIQTGSLPDA